MRLLICLPLLLAAGCSSIIGLDEFSDKRAVAGGGGMGGVAGQAGNAGSSPGGAAGVAGANASGAGSGAAGGVSGTGAGSGGDSTGGAAGTSGGTGGAGPTEFTIAELRLRPDGFVNGVLRDVYVTYVRASGFYVQENREGPALYVYSTAVSSVAVGNRIDLEVLKVGTFGNYRQLENVTVVLNDNGAYDVVTNLAQTISTGSGIPLGEDLESELLVVTRGKVIDANSPSFLVEYGSSAVSAKLHAGEEPGLCLGATFDFSGVMVDWTTGPQLHSEHAADFANIDTSGCSN